MLSMTTRWKHITICYRLLFFWVVIFLAIYLLKALHSLFCCSVKWCPVSHSSPLIVSPLFTVDKRIPAAFFIGTSETKVLFSIKASMFEKYFLHLAVSSSFGILRLFLCSVQYKLMFYLKSDNQTVGLSYDRWCIVFTKICCIAFYKWLLVLPFYKIS